MQHTPSRIGRRRLLAAALLGLPIAGLTHLVGDAEVRAADVSVNIVDFTFDPTPLTIPVGTTVVWTNQDTAPHTATSDTGVWNTGTLAKGQAGRFTFAQAGTFPYHCNFHSTMHGTVVVTGAAAPAPTATGGGPGQFASDAFQQLWAKTDANPSGGVYVWGPGPFTGGLMEEYKEATGGKRLVQYFDKGRMEFGAGNTVTAGLLTVELITGRQQNGDATYVQRQPAKVTVAGDPDNAFPQYADLAKLQAAEPNTGGATIGKLYNPDGSFGIYGPAAADALTKTTGYDDATKHNVPKAFADFRNSPALGGIQAIGLAITEAVWAIVKVGGKTLPVLVQAFERRVLTYTPDNPILARVEYGNIGRAYQTWRYGP